MGITSEPIDNGHRFTDGEFIVDITSHERFFTIYFVGSCEPCGTITRPAVMGGNRKWESHLPNGAACTITAVGPRSAFRSFIMAYKEN